MRNARNNWDCLHKKTPVEMLGPSTRKHCVTNMAADEEAAITAVIVAIFLVNTEEEEKWGDCFGFPECFGSPI